MRSGENSAKDHITEETQEGHECDSHHRRHHRQLYGQQGTKHETAFLSLDGTTIQDHRGLPKATTLQMVQPMKKLPR